MACKLHEAIEFSKAYSAGDFTIDCVSKLIEVKSLRDHILMRTANLSHDMNLAGVQAIVNPLQTCSGRKCLFRPMDMIYLGLTEGTEESHESMLVQKKIFYRKSSIQRGASIELFDKLLPLTNKHEVNYCIDTVQALAQLLYNKQNPPGPATPPPDN